MALPSLLFLVEVTGLRTEIRRVASVTPNASNQENDQHSLCNKTSMSNVDIDVFAVSRYHHYRKNKRDGIAIPFIFGAGVHNETTQNTLLYGVQNIF